MCHEAQNQDALAKGGGKAYDYSYAFKYIAPYISASDYAIGNLETTIVPNGARPSDFPAFGAPASFAEAVKNAGFDLVTTANNHALDFGQEGLAHTLEALDGIGLEHTGTYAAEADSRNITVVDVNGIAFAILSYTRGTNVKPPKDSPWCVNGADKIKDDIARAKKMNPDVIIAMAHTGMEYETDTREVFKNEVYELLQAGADIVLSSHPHVLQPVEFVTVTDADGTERDCFAAYSLGNFISSQRIAPRDFGMIANLRFKKTGGGETTLDSVDLMPVWVKFTAPDGSYDITVLPIGELDKPEFAEAVLALRPGDIERLGDVKSEFAGMFPGFAPVQ
jgi:poly-gamma-glutamate synthesis protein (capsule biosynthesis protein)